MLGLLGFALDMEVHGTAMTLNVITLPAYPAVHGLPRLYMLYIKLLAATRLYEPTSMVSGFSAMALEGRQGYLLMFTKRDSRFVF